MIRTTSPKRRFANTLIAATAAFGLLTAATALPARAETDADTIAKWIAGLAALALIADAVKDDDKKDRRPVTVAPHPQPQPHPQPGGHGWGRDDRRGDDWRRGGRDDWRDGRPHRDPVVVRPVKPQVKVEPQMPRICRVNVQGIRGETRAYVESCLRAQGLREALPQRCGTLVSIKGRPDRVYGANCMADIGVYGRQKKRN